MRRRCQCYFGVKWDGGGGGGADCVLANMAPTLGRACCFFMAAQKAAPATTRTQKRNATGEKRATGSDEIKAA